MNKNESFLQKKFAKKLLASLSAAAMLCAACAVPAFAQETETYDAETQAYLDSLQNADDLRIANLCLKNGISLYWTKVLVSYENGTYVMPEVTVKKAVESTDPYYGETDNGIVYQFDGETLTLSKDDSIAWFKGDVEIPVQYKGELNGAYTLVQNTADDHLFDRENYVYPWDAFAGEIKHIVFEDDFDTLNNWEFYDCVNLESFDYALKDLWSTSLPPQITSIYLKDSDSAPRGTFAEDVTLYGYQGNQAQFRSLEDGSYHYAATQGDSAYPAYVLNGSSGLESTYSFDQETQTLTISGTGTALTLTGTGLLDYTKHIVVEEGITELYDTFAKAADNKVYPNVEDISLPDSLTTMSENALETLTSVNGSTETILYGDANLDGNVNLLDTVTLSKAVNDTISVTEAQRVRMDCNGDGEISADDTLSLLRFLTHVVDTLPESAE